jgi:hypothetical protein
MAWTTWRVGCPQLRRAVAAIGTGPEVSKASITSGAGVDDDVAFRIAGRRRRRPLGSREKSVSLTGNGVDLSMTMDGCPTCEMVDCGRAAGWWGDAAAARLRRRNSHEVAILAPAQIRIDQRKKPRHSRQPSRIGAAAAADVGLTPTLD